MYLRVSNPKPSITNFSLRPVPILLLPDTGAGKLAPADDDDTPPLRSRKNLSDDEWVRLDEEEEDAVSFAFRTRYTSLVGGSCPCPRS
jgi:hypothetical protein